MANVIKLEAFAEKKIFVDADTGNNFPYYAIHCLVNGQQIKLSIPKESKALLNYLLDSASNKG